MTAKVIVCDSRAFRHCKGWWEPCETKMPAHNEAERLRFDLDAKRLDLTHAKGVWRFGIVQDDRVDADGRTLTVVRRLEPGARALVFKIGRGGAFVGTGDDGRFEMRGACKPL